MEENRNEASRLDMDEEAQKQPEDTGKSKAREGEGSLKEEIFSWIRAFAFAIVIALVLNNFVILNVTVPSGSMENTIMTGDRLFGLRLNYLFTSPKRGDIVVFNYPVDEALGKKRKFIKRIIGLPGETVEIRNAKIYIDGSETPLDETYLKEEWVRGNDGYYFEVPEDSYLMMGDNRNSSSDARAWPSVAKREFASAGKTITDEEAAQLSYVKRSAILGKAYLRYWPLTQISFLK